MVEGREPWSSGNGRWLMVKRSWVQILAPYTGWNWNFLTVICCKNCKDVCLKSQKINEKEAGVGPFFTKKCQQKKLWSFSELLSPLFTKLLNYISEVKWAMIGWMAKQSFDGGRWGSPRKCKTTDMSPSKFRGFGTDGSLHICKTCLFVWIYFSDLLGRYDQWFSYWKTIFVTWCICTIFDLCLFVNAKKYRLNG